MVSAQGAELIVLARAACLGSGKRVTIYTDSRYAFGVCHTIGILWKELGFLTSSGKAVANGAEIWDLLDTIQLPKEIAVVHCPAHTRDTTVIGQGNALAHAAEKAAARQPAAKTMAVTSDKSSWPDVDHPKELYQSDVTSEEKEQWKKWEAVEDEDGIWTIGGKPVLPKKYLMTVNRWFHDRAHGGMEAVANQVQ